MKAMKPARSLALAGLVAGTLAACSGVGGVDDDDDDSDDDDSDSASYRLQDPENETPGEPASVPDTETVNDSCEYVVNIDVPLGDYTIYGDFGGKFRIEQDWRGEVFHDHEWARLGVRGDIYFDRFWAAQEVDTVQPFYREASWVQAARTLGPYWSGTADFVLKTSEDVPASLLDLDVVRATRYYGTLDEETGWSGQLRYYPHRFLDSPIHQELWTPGSDPRVGDGDYFTDVSTLLEEWLDSVKEASWDDPSINEAWPDAVESARESFRTQVAQLAEPRVAQCRIAAIKGLRIQ